MRNYLNSQIYRFECGVSVIHAQFMYKMGSHGHTLVGVNVWRDEWAIIIIAFDFIPANIYLRSTKYIMRRTVLVNTVNTVKNGIWKMNSRRSETKYFGTENLLHKMFDNNNAVVRERVHTTATAAAAVAVAAAAALTPNNQY